MKIALKEVETGKLFEALVLPAEKTEMPLKKDGWRFTWRELVKTEGAFFYKVVLEGAPTQVEGMLMLTLINEEMLFMNNIEVAPHNYGSKGRFDNIAGSLIAFGCKKSFELGKGHYLGFLAFESKTELIPLYEEKYGATWAMGQKMFIDPEAGKKLMEKYLNIKI